MESTELPDKDSLTLHLVVATPEENHAQTVANSEEWRGPLSDEAYLRREAHLSTLDLTRDGGLTAWMLVYQPEATGPRRVLCGCETYKKRALVSRNGVLEAGICHGVGSVFCRSQYRGRGYTSRMMSELRKRLQTWQVDVGQTCLFSILFSDIGKDFYAAKGWHPFPSTHVALPATTATALPDVQLLSSHDIPELCAADEALVRKRLVQMGEKDRTTIAVLPDRRTMEWHHAREDVVGQELQGAKPIARGASFRISPTQRVWCYWVRVWTSSSELAPNTLHILRLVIEDEAYADFAPASPQRAAELQDSAIAGATAALLTRAQQEAEKWDMKEVCIWNPTSATLAAVRRLDDTASVITRQKESIASLLWYGDTSWLEVDWICNEKYSWC